MKILPYTLSLLSLASLPAFGTISMEFQLGWDPATVPGTTAVLVADTDPIDRDFSGIDTPTTDLLGRTLTVGSVFGSDDLILAIFSADLSIGTDPNKGIQGSLSGYSLPAGVDEGDHLAIYWFDGPVPTSPIEAGQTGGFYRTDVADVNSGANSAFLVPADGTNGLNVFAFSSTINGATTVPDSAFEAGNFSVIPEPSGAALIALSGLLFVRRRRR